MFASRRSCRFLLASAIAASVAASASIVHAQEVSPGVDDVPELAGLRARWMAAMESLNVPGFSIAIVKDGRVLALDAIGVRDVAGKPATPDTFYYIASATKPFTAMGVCLLAEEGKIDLDAPVKKYLPQLQLADAKLTESLAVRDLLCHRHGITSGPIVHRDAYTGEIDDATYFRLLKTAEIAGQVEYSNVHFTLAGRVIEAASGKKWQDFLNERLFDPAGMTRTTAYASEMYGDADHAEPMLLIDGAWKRSPLVKTDRTMHAAGGMGTTARDAARWLMLNLGGGEIDGKRLLARELAGEYYSRQSGLPQPRGRIRIEEGFALGWQIGKYRDASRPYSFHGGGYVGASSYFCFLPEQRIGVAVLSNCGNGGAIATIASIDVLDRLLGIKDQPDLLPTYQEEAKRQREDPRSATPGGVNPASARDGLTLDAATYAGVFVNAEYGHIQVAVNDDGALELLAGNLRATLLSDGKDGFHALVVPGMMLDGRFVLDDVKSGVAALALTIDDRETIFTREK